MLAKVSRNRHGPIIEYMIGSFSRRQTADQGSECWTLLYIIVVPDCGVIANRLKEGDMRGLVCFDN
jgi:hypothetical protein